MSSTYRRERYSSRKARVKEGRARVLSTVFVLMASLIIIFWQWQKTNDLKEDVWSKTQLITTFEEELSILRTLNPYQVASNDIIAQAVENIDLFPGWVARVYPVPKNQHKALSMQDLGSFVMNETQFSLSSHKSYGIPQPSKGMYRLNGLFPSHKAGRLQVGVELQLSGSSKESEESISQICSCYVRVDINQKRVIDKKLHMVTRYQDEKVITGEVELEKGLFPISAVLYCDEDSDFSGDEVQVSILFRNANQYKLTTSRHAVFHIYKPDNYTAKL